MKRERNMNRNKGKRFKENESKRKEPNLKTKIKSKKKEKRIIKILKYILLVILIPISIILDIILLILKQLYKMFELIVKFVSNHRKLSLKFITLFILICIALSIILPAYNNINNINNKLEDMNNKQIELEEKLQIKTEEYNIELENKNKEIEDKSKELETKNTEIENKNNEIERLRKEVAVTSRGGTTSRSSSTQGKTKLENSSIVATTGTKAEYQSYAKDLCINTYGWSENDFNCLVKLWERESNWNPNAHNKSSGAHGICQSLPASKMASEGADYMTNGKTQIRWGLKYIKNRYGTPASAWSHSQQKGWY